ncbi:putative P-loop containing nucleoside triphosphate hydrolase [Medicago truncatula]|uniref:Putative P-loop containing nucleoside triphosphate hydrolase n=1 Tax=Medicago truncatula TaxID=3880 RepID=A0A072V6Q3_MEDTR|nr:protein ROOT HAIR DEFECTIVE 3 homolog 2 [Medicago truncatula]KEH37033.1 ROOT HAIR defective 3 GTP-binding protein [Medicago truncatula]RHN72820.1 putative P-loop containing nucleoside triphosphate hydrolase [Medicago truncatula]
MANTTTVDDSFANQVQLIDGEGVFNVTGLDNLIKTSDMANTGLDYVVVSIMGPQSSGKSSLLNNIFCTKFEEMNALTCRSQTTKGIWIAKTGIKPCTFALDIEGTDGRERGEDDTAFEKQSALFALALSNIVLINLWCHDVGREQAASKPLLRTVFQVMLRLFSPRKITLIFVLRDKTKTPLKILEPILREDIQKIWDAIPKPQAHAHTPLHDFFNVEVTALSSYETQEEEFKEEVSELREHLYHSIASRLAGDRRGAVPASAFSISAHHIWEVIRDNKDLDLPAHKVMVATVRCEAIAKEKLDHLRSDKGLLELKKAAQSGSAQGFGEKLSSIISTYRSRYDEETEFFDEAVRNAKGKQFESDALNIVYPVYTKMIEHLCSKALDDFNTELIRSLNSGERFDSSVRTWTRCIMVEFEKVFADVAVRQANWDASKVRDKLRCDINSHALFVRNAKLPEITTSFEKQLAKALATPVQSLFEKGGNDTWLSIRNLLKCETEVAVSEFVARVAGFDLEKETVEKMQQDLREYARELVVNKAREEAGKVLIRMKDRFSTVFDYDNDSQLRVWTWDKDIKAIKKDAYSASLKLLSDMVAIRLDEKPDQRERVLDLKSFLYTDRDLYLYLLDSITWKVSPGDILISPGQCKSLWRQLQDETVDTIRQAIAAKKEDKKQMAATALQVATAGVYLGLATMGVYLG